MLMLANPIEKSLPSSTTLFSYPPSQDWAKDKFLKFALIVIFYEKFSVSLIQSNSYIFSLNYLGDHIQLSKFAPMHKDVKKGNWEKINRSPHLMTWSISKSKTLSDFFLFKKKKSLLKFVCLCDYIFWDFLSSYFVMRHLRKILMNFSSLYFVFCAIVVVFFRYYLPQRFV